MAGAFTVTGKYVRGILQPQARKENRKAPTSVRKEEEVEEEGGEVRRKKESAKMVVHMNR